MGGAPAPHGQNFGATIEKTERLCVFGSEDIVWLQQKVRQVLPPAADERFGARFGQACTCLQLFAQGSSVFGRFVRRFPCGGDEQILVVVFAAERERTKGGDSRQYFYRALCE